MKTTQGHVRRFRIPAFSRRECLELQAHLAFFRPKNVQK